MFIFELIIAVFCSFHSHINYLLLLELRSFGSCFRLICPRTHTSITIFSECFSSVCHGPNAKKGEQKRYCESARGAKTNQLKTFRLPVKWNNYFFIWIFFSAKLYHVKFASFWFPSHVSLFHISSHTLCSPFLLDGKTVLYESSAHSDMKCSKSEIILISCVLIFSLYVLFTFWWYKSIWLALNYPTRHIRLVLGLLIIFGYAFSVILTLVFLASRIVRWRFWFNRNFNLNRKQSKFVRCIVISTVFLPPTSPFFFKNHHIFALQSNSVLFIKH